MFCGSRSILTSVDSQKHVAAHALYLILSIQQWCVVLNVSNHVHNHLLRLTHPEDKTVITRPSTSLLYQILSPFSAFYTYVVDRISILFSSLECNFLTISWVQLLFSMICEWFCYKCLV